ncbi:MAG: acyl-CoA dehydrogenase family protein [Nitrospinae bacterium]|nr:acyl-CoA dehydrogenase family protein [Nitrospinota bacterium]
MIDLTDEQRLLLQTVRRLAQEKIAPRAAEVDATDQFPWDWVDLFRQQGLLQMMVPAEYGGGGIESVTTLCLITEELARHSLAAASIFASTPLTSVQLLKKVGTPEQKTRYFPQLSTGEKLSAIALTEPGAGSDAASLQARARREGDHYILNGRKCFCTMGDVADFITIFAKTDPTKGVNGITAFFLETKGTPGFSIGKHENKMGLRGIPNVELILEEVPVPAENRLGQEGEGFKVVMKFFDTARAIVGAKALGLAQGALDCALAYAQERVQFGRPIAELQAIQFMLADMATEIEAARGLVYNTMARIDRGEKEVSKYSAMAKYYASDVAMKVTTDAVQILGGYGYMKDYPVERMMRDAKLTQIYDGTNQIQRIVVARSLLKGGSRLRQTN